MLVACFELCLWAILGSDTHFTLQLRQLLLGWQHAKAHTLFSAIASIVIWNRLLLKCLVCKVLQVHLLFVSLISFLLDRMNDFQDLLLLFFGTVLF